MVSTRLRSVIAVLAGWTSCVGLLQCRWGPRHEPLQNRPTLGFLFPAFLEHLTYEPGYAGAALRGPDSRPACRFFVQGDGDVVHWHKIRGALVPFRLEGGFTQPPCREWLRSRAAWARRRLHGANQARNGPSKPVSGAYLELCINRNNGFGWSDPVFFVSSGKIRSAAVSSSRYRAGRGLGLGFAPPCREQQ